MTTTIAIILLILSVILIITDNIITYADDDLVPEMLFFIHLPLFGTCLIESFCHLTQHDMNVMVWFIGVFGIITLIHLLVRLSSYSKKSHEQKKHKNAVRTYEAKEIEVCTEPEYVDDKVSCFKAYKIKMFWQYKKEKWDEFIIHCIFSSKDILDELFKHKLEIDQYRADPSYVLNEKNAEFIKKYFKFDETYDGDIDLNNLKYTVWTIDDRHIFIIAGPNKNLELCNGTNKQFLCYAFVYGNDDNMIMADYSIDNLMHRINNYFGS